MTIMEGTYTPGLNLRKPEEWSKPWHEYEWQSKDILDVVLVAMQRGNNILSGGEVTEGAGLTVDYTATSARIDGLIRDNIAGNLAVSLADAGTEKSHWIYVDDTGSLVASSTLPTGNYTPLAMVDTDETSIVRIADLRVMGLPNGYAVEDLCINGDESINQRGFNGTWSSVSVGEYGHDRWRRGTTASTKEQPVINTSIHAGSHVLSWDGGGSGDLEQSSSSVVSGTSPLIGTLADQTEALLIVPESASNIRFYPGDQELPVRKRTFAEALHECQFYYQKSYRYSNAPGWVTNKGCAAIKAFYSSTQLWLGDISLVRSMRTIPSLTGYSADTGLANMAFNISSGDTSIVFVNASDRTIGDYCNLGDAVSVGGIIRIHWTAEAEL